MTFNVEWLEFITKLLLKRLCLLVKVINTYFVVKVNMGFFK